MIYGTGIDIVEVQRIQDKVTAGKGFCKAVYTKQEILYCESKGDRKHESYAARFAAKEAFLKAIGTGWIGEYDFNMIEVSNQPSGKPVLLFDPGISSVLKEKNIIKCHLTLSHTTEYAVANVILETA